MPALELLIIFQLLQALTICHLDTYWGRVGDLVRACSWLPSSCRLSFLPGKAKELVWIHTVSQYGVRIQLCCAPGLNSTEELTRPVIQLQPWRALKGFIYASACPQKTYLPGLVFLPLPGQGRCYAMLGRCPNCPRSRSRAWSTATYCDVLVTQHARLPRTYKCWQNFLASDIHLRFSLSTHNQHHLTRKA